MQKQQQQQQQQQNGFVHSPVGTKRRTSTPDMSARTEVEYWRGGGGVGGMCTGKRAASGGDKKRLAGK